MGDPKNIKQTKSGFDSKDPGQAEKQSKMRKCNAKLEHDDERNLEAKPLAPPRFTTHAGVVTRRAVRA